MIDKAGEREAKIVRIVKACKGRFVSGQMISERLGITRAGVWKHIKGLREMGYPLEASPSKGYRLNKGALPFCAVEVLSSLETVSIGQNLFFYPTLESTNQTALCLAQKGAPEGTAVIADAQSSGKGRLDRRWFSPAGKNLYTSIILRPEIGPVCAPILALMFSVATAETVASYTGGKRPTVKWPNDIMLDSMKVAGILAQMSSDADRINHIIAGIGVNLNMKASMLFSKIGQPAISIKEASGHTVERACFTRALYTAIEKWYKVYSKEGAGKITRAWKGYFDSEGKRIRVAQADGPIEGICMGIDETAALLIKTASGRELKVVSGDMDLV
ncbi:MAG: biotin--[acetyl-CoA-carboxylase] ligase [Deltaproteobacteria bacterium]|nr:biotin--[acetyl-CoA-carboxylase] ligase [Deltaproteobacteria bacterium]